MRPVKAHDKRAKRGSGERGAALITTLLVSTLLLTAGGALLLTTTMTATNTVDSTAEAQAYYAAESGMQMTMNVLRGNVSPALSFRTAVTPSASNKSGDSSTVARLSNWLNYDTNLTDRAILTYPTSNYSSINGLAFKAELTDPDNSAFVSYTTTGAFSDGTTSKTFGNGNAQATVAFTGATQSAINGCPTLSGTVCSPSTASGVSLGTFTVSMPSNSSGASVPAGTVFNINITQTLPWAGTVTLVCTLEGNVTKNTSNLVLTLPALVTSVEGAKYTISAQTATLNPPNTSSGQLTLSNTVTAPDPRRVLVKITGMGPRSSTKQMQMMVKKFYLDYSPRGTVAIRGADSGAVMTFNAGSSSSYVYSGTDTTANASISGFAVTNQNDYDLVKTSISSGQVFGSPGVQLVSTSGLASWLQTADEARATLNRLQQTAIDQKRYFTTATAPTSYPGFGTKAEPKFTFVDGDLVLPNKDSTDGVSGAGLLVVTGKLTMDGTSPFAGLVLVLGEGNFERNGGGNGNTLGAMAVARFPRTGNGGFLQPTFNGNGSGTSNLDYNMVWVEKALNTGSRYVLGVSEY